MFNKNKRLLITIFLSVVIHIIILLILHYSVSHPATVTAKPQPRRLIQAKLIFELPKPTKIKLKPAVPIEPQIEPTSKPVKTKPSKPVAKPVQPPPISRPKASAEAIAPKKSQTSTHHIPTPKITSPATINSQFTGTAGKHVQQFNLQQDAEMAAEASRYFQQRKNYPTLDTTNRNSFISEEQKLINNIKIRANCDGVIRKTTAIFLGFMGGKVDCTIKPNIDSFIDKRINKENLLGAKYQKPLKKHPQSLVIKE